MKKLFLMGLLTLSLVFSMKLVGADAASFRNIVPSDAAVVLYVDSTRIIESKAVNQLLNKAGLDLDAILKEVDVKKSDCKGSALLFAKIAGTQAAPKVEIGGVTVVPSAAVSFQKMVDAIEKEMKENKADNEKTSFKKIKIGGQSAFTVEDPAEKVALCAIQTSDDSIQFRLFIGVKPAFTALPVRVVPAALTSQINARKMFSAAFDVDAIRKFSGMDGEAADPIVSAIHKTFFSVSEGADAFDVDAVVASDAANVKQLQETCKTLIDSMKQNPEFAPALEKTIVKAAGNDLRIKAVLPVSFLSALIENAMGNDDDLLDDEDDEDDDGLLDDEDDEDDDGLLDDDDDE